MNERRPADGLTIDVGKDALPGQRSSDRPLAIAVIFGRCIDERRAVPAVSDGNSAKLQGLVDSRKLASSSSAAHPRGGVKVNGSIAERSVGHKVKKDLGVLIQVEAPERDDVMGRLEWCAPRCTPANWAPRFRDLGAQERGNLSYERGSTDGDMKHKASAWRQKPRYVSYKRV
jgi:hypothetical protein